VIEASRLDIEDELVDVHGEPAPLKEAEQPLHELEGEREP
jgi:hypothetical protein